MSVERYRKLADFMEELVRDVYSVRVVKTRLVHDKVAKKAKKDAIDGVNHLRFCIDNPDAPCGPSFGGVSDVVGDLIVSLLDVPSMLFRFLDDFDSEKLSALIEQWVKDRKLSDVQDVKDVFLAELTLYVLERLVDKYKQTYRENYKHIDDRYREQEENDELSMFNKHLQKIIDDEVSRKNFIAELQNTDRLYEWLNQYEDVPF